MSFQDFCNAAEDIDKQKIKASEAFTIRFENTKGEYFYVDPNDLVGFIKLVRDNFDECVHAITSQPTFKNEHPYEYEEKGYRALYKLAEEKGLKIIGSIGKSQTKSLARVIAKLISFVSGHEYLDVTKHSGIEKSVIVKTLSLIPDDFSDFIKESTVKIQPSLMKEMFIAWLLGKSKSQKTAKSYAGTSINLANKLLQNLSADFSNVYSVDNLDELEKHIEILENESEEWKQKNTDGNSMFRAGLNHYHSFLQNYLNNEQKQLQLTGTRLCLPKPFILLAGISGTGKTRFVRKQASAYSVGDSNYCLVPVRPDWHEPSDLLGYISRLSGKPEYVSTKTLNFIIKAWKAIAPQADKSGHGELDFSVPPYWLCLDEMNLAPVEQYFADYLSVLESRKFEDDKYTSEALLDKSQLVDLKQQGADVQKDLGLTGDNELWEYFLNHGISIPPNLIVAGTVNMDETTHGFSRKVIDRALTIDFGEFYPNDYEYFFDSPVKPKIFSYSLLTQATRDDLSKTFDTDGSKTIRFLTEVNKVLKRTPFELAYRAMNELLLQVACFNPKDEAELQAVWDDFLMSKILPRIDGDEDKLRLISNDTETNVLLALTRLLKLLLDKIWDTGRHDYYRENDDGSDIKDIPCRTKDKLDWMIDRLETNTFTSFWP